MDFYTKFQENLEKLTEEDLDTSKPSQNSTETGLGFATEYEVDSILDNTKNALTVAQQRHMKAHAKELTGLLQPEHIGFAGAVSKFVSPEDLNVRFYDRIEDVDVVHNAYYYSVDQSILRKEIPVSLTIAIVNFTPEAFRRIMEFEFAKIYSTVIPDVNKKLQALVREIGYEINSNLHMSSATELDPNLLRYTERAPKIIHDGLLSVVKRIEEVCKEAQTATDKDNLENNLVYGMDLSVGQYYITTFGQTSLFGLLNGI
jgi:hypothetical protein